MILVLVETDGSAVVEVSRETLTFARALGEAAPANAVNGSPVSR